MSGEQIWRAPDTEVFTVAKLRLIDEAAQIGALRALGGGAEAPVAVSS